MFSYENKFQDIWCCYILDDQNPNYTSHFKLWLNNRHKYIGFNQVFVILLHFPIVFSLFFKVKRGIHLLLFSFLILSCGLFESYR